MHVLLTALLILSVVAGCASPEAKLPPQTSAGSRQQRTSDTASPVPQLIPKLPASKDTLPPGYSLSNTTEWSSLLEEGQRAVLRRGGVMIDTVDLAFGVVAVGTDSLVFLPVRTDTTPLGTTPEPAYESFPTEHVFWTPASQRKLHDLLPFFDDYFSIPKISGSVIHYWGIARRDSTNRLYAMRYNFRTAHLDSLFLNREDHLATDYRYYLGTPQTHGREVSFDRTVVDSATWRMIRQDSLPTKE